LIYRAKENIIKDVAGSGFPMDKNGSGVRGAV
jgi:hypothetical protein